MFYYYISYIYDDTIINIILYYILLYYIILYYITLYYIILYYIMCPDYIQFYQRQTFPLRTSWLMTWHWKTTFKTNTTHGYNFMEHPASDFLNMILHLLERDSKNASGVVKCLKKLACFICDGIRLVEFLVGCAFLALSLRLPSRRLDRADVLEHLGNWMIIWILVQVSLSSLCLRSLLFATASFFALSSRWRFSGLRLNLCALCCICNCGVCGITTSLHVLAWGSDRLLWLWGLQLISIRLILYKERVTCYSYITLVILNVEFVIMASIINNDNKNNE